MMTRSKNNNNLKSEKGALSIFVVIWIPIVMIGTVYIFSLLNQEHQRNQSMKLALINSDVTLSVYSDYMMDNYGLMAYLHTDQLGKNIERSLDQNRLKRPQQIHTTPYGLNRVDVFAKASLEASVVLVPLGLYDSTFNNVSSEAVETENKEVDRAFKKKDDAILKLMGSQRHFNRLLQIKQLNFSLNSVVSAIEDWERETAVLNRDHSSHHSAIKEMYVSQLRAHKSQLDQIHHKITWLDSQVDLEEESYELELEALENLIKTWIDQARQKPPSIIGQINTLVQRLTQLKNNQSPVDNEPVHIENTNWDRSRKSVVEDWTAIQKWQVKEYLLSVFKSHDKASPRNIDPLNKKMSRESGFLGEVEFLIAGNNNDTRNFQQVKLQIFALRELSNLAHVLTSAQKTSQITQLTVGLPVPWNMVAYSGIVLLWSGAESYVDVMRLVDGEGLSLIKTNEEWFLSLDQLLSGNWLDKDVHHNKDHDFLDPKWYYQDYLRMFLYLKPFTEVLERAMTLVDIDLRLDTHSKYGLKDFARGHVVELEWESDRFIFTNRYRRDDHEEE